MTHLMTHLYSILMTIVLVIGMLGVAPAIAAPAMPQPVIAAIATPPLTLTNKFQVDPAQVEDFLDRWDAIGTYMKQQPGFISAELKKDILNRSTWIMTEAWSSLEDYQRAVHQAEFQRLVQDFPAQANWFAPDLFSAHS